MAQFKNDPFPGTDYGQYLSWKPIQMPGGQVFYEVPGFPGYVYDPVASNATGRKTFRANPQQQIDQVKQQEKLAKQQEFNQSPAGQLVPIGGSIAGLYAASELAKGSNPLAALGESGGAKIVSDAAAQGASQGAGQIAQQAGQVAPQTPSIVSASRVPGEAVAADTGSFWTTNAPANGSLGQIAAAAAAAKGTYDVFKGYQQGGEGMRTGLTEAGAGFGTMFGGPIGGAIGAVGGNVLGYGLQGDGIKNDLALAASGVGIPLLIAKKMGVPLVHQTTRQKAQENTQQFLKDAEGDDVATAYVKGMREQYNAPPTDKSKPFAGKYSTFEEYKKNGLQANDLTGVEGNLKVYTPKVWANLTQPQREAVTQANIDSGLYASKKGAVNITDEKKAKENFDNVMKGFQVGAQTAATPAAPIVVTPAQAAAAGANQQKFVKPILKIT